MRSSILLPIALLVGLASIFVVMFGLKATAPILNPILLAIVITIAVLPLSHWLMRHRLSPWLAIAVTVLFVVGGMLLVLILFGYGVAGLSARVPEYADSIASKSSQVWSQMQQLGADLSEAPSTGDITPLLETLVDSFVGAITVVFTTLLIFVFLLAGSVSLAAGSRKGLDIQDSTVKKINDFTLDIRKYINITTLLTFLAGVLNTILLLILGVDFAVLWGVLSWLLGYIPAVGFWLALIPPTILAWMEFGVPTAAIVFIGYVLINGLTDNIIAPKMQGDSLNISPVFVMLSLIVWGWILGAVGAILSIPMTLLVLTIMEQFDATRGLAALVRTQPRSGETDADHQAHKDRAKQQIADWFGRIKAAVEPGADAQSPTT